MVGIEPTTYGFGDRCATNCATPVSFGNFTLSILNCPLILYAKNMSALHSIYNFKFEIFNYRQRRAGFTLIELMIAITIVAIISTVGIISYSKAQSLGRDAKRKQDLRSIAIALELYYQKNKTFPTGGTNCNYAGGWCRSQNNNPWIPQLDINYMSDVPKDPNSNTDQPWWSPGGGYAYIGISCGGNTPPYFALITTLENANDPDTLAKKNYKWCGGATMPWHPQLFAITAW